MFVSSNSQSLHDDIYTSSDPYRVSGGRGQGAEGIRTELVFVKWQRNSAAQHSVGRTEKNQVCHFPKIIMTTPAHFVFGNQPLRQVVAFKISCQPMPQTRMHPPSGRERILLVEDDTEVRMLMRIVLEGVG